MQEKENDAKPEDQRDATVPSRAAFLRRYDLDRLPPDAALWIRAAQILRQRPTAKVGLGPTATIAREEALKAARKSVALDPQLPVAQEILKQLESEIPTKRSGSK